MRIRMTYWSFLFGLVVGALISYTFISDNDRQEVYGPSPSCGYSGAHQINCSIEGRRKVKCLTDASDVYLPFNRFVRRQFDVYGRLVNANTSSEYFEYFTSYSKSKKPDIRNYSSVGVFGNFGTFNVEKRDRVKCMDGSTGLPMSCQWSSRPYFYPVQIAQFGLQHYSRLISDPPPMVKTLGPDFISAQSNEHLANGLVTLDKTDDFVVISLLPDTELSVVKFQWMPLSASSLFIFIVQNVETGQTYTINYIFSARQDCLWSSPSLDNHSKNSDFFYSLGAYSSSKTTLVIRDLNVDTIKSLVSHLPPNPLKKDPMNTGNTQADQFKPISLTFRGSAQIRLPLYQQTSSHKELFLLTADWLLSTQDQNGGGWKVPVSREVANIKNTLEPGWISAMGQGHGLSVLVRAYNMTGDTRYADAVLNALRPFETETIDGGVRNHFLGLSWYEEYPTQPPSLVLNGFIYSLVGLYDASTMTSQAPEASSKAKRLFESGLDSLRVLLPFYDTGRGSTYDLKHATVRSVPNLARPDYHKAHVYLLKWLHIITGEAMFERFSNRWYSYSIGEHAKTNG